ncbi:MAG TPA: hypothetical protein VME22_08400 [Solirubrobacteraceae bacterium]|nr:hypothetical protein [Solirubrobacteraceae bacterium]
MPAGDTLSQAAANPLKRDNKPGAFVRARLSDARDEHRPVPEPWPAFVTQDLRPHSPRVCESSEHPARVLLTGPAVDPYSDNRSTRRVGQLPGQAGLAASVAAVPTSPNSEANFGRM